MKKNNFKKLFLLGVFFIFSFSLQAQNKQELNKIKEKYDQKKLTSLKNSFKEKSSTQKKNALKIAKEKGWKIKFTTQDGRLLELQKVVNGKPIYYTTFNVAAAKSTRVDHLNAGGSLGLNLEGQNMTAHVWDGGIARASHQEYDGAGGNNRFSAGDSGSLNYHSAHVTGTIMASGVVANSKGMAPHSSVIGYDWNSDLSEATSAASNGMLVSNHSYGYATRNALGQVQVPQYYFGGYIEDSRDWDDIMFNAPNYLMVVAAGNDGDDDTANTDPTGGYGFDKLTGHSTAKNNLVVAAANDASIDTNGNLLSATIANFSSEGPTDDFRIKPDIAGNGVSVYSTYDNNDTAYNSISGTSMASPNITGSLVLLQQHYNNLNNSFMKAATLKGLTLHTADDAGFSGPDAIFGWGLMNSKAAAEAITNKGNESKIDELTLTSGQTYSITVDSDGINPLLASISWTDRAGTANTGTVNLTTPVLVNDLDIRVTQGVTSHLPYELTGATTNAKQDNNVDPYERVDVSGASGTYTITVTNKGSLIGGNQNFSLIVTGLTGTPVVCNATVPSNVIVNNLDPSTASISWDAVATASYDVRYRQTGTSAWITSAVSASNISLTGLSPETSYEVQVRSKCSDGATSAYSNSLNFTTTEVQLNYCASNGNSVADEYISNVNLGSIDNTTGASSGGYADYTSQSTNLTKGTSATITITPTWTGTLYNEGYAVFIDYNKDGDFDDSGETVWTNAASQTTPVSGSFTVPTSVITGKTRMRVVMQYNTTPSSCGSFDYGETEDYNVNLVTAAADTTSPIITLNGAPTINLNVGDTYNELGATASDNADGDLTSSVTTTGTVDTNTVGSYTINYNVSDAAGNTATQVSRTIIVSDGTAPIITLNGAATININVGDTYTEQGATATDNVDGNLTSSIITTGTVDTNTAGIYTVNYNVSDAAGNAATQVSRTVNVSNGGCTNGVSTFPYNEGFENTLGAWTQSSSDDIDWTISSGGTPSGSTGPNSANQGTYYIYVEASGNGTGYPTKQAIINSPCYDLSGETEATFSFSYHMYGAANMGTIDLEISSDDGATWNSIWNESGNKGNSWQTATINLNAYVGGSVQLRYNRITGNTWQADIALDNVQITNGSGAGTNGCVAEITSFPYTESFENTLGSWSQSSSDDINWTINSAGTPSSNTGPTAANQGTYYIYVEASGSAGYPTKQAIINSPCFDLSGLSVASFNFDYHMYGATDMGTIDLEASNDNGASWTSIWSQSGNKGNSWQSASVDLSFYLGNTVQLRFNRVTGGTWQADIALDNINLSNTAANNVNSFTSTTSSNSVRTFQMYPNPAKDILNIKLATDGISTFRIVDVLGKTVKSGSISNQPINISRLKTGIYLIEINDGEEIILEKFIKQ